jgi:hypothetical protein
MVEVSDSARQTIEAVTQRMRDANSAAQSNAGAVGSLGNAYEAAGNKITATTATIERNARVNKEAAATTKDVVAWFKELGLVLESDVTAALEKNAARLDFVRDNYRALGLQIEDVANLEALVAASNTELTQSFIDQAGAVEAATGGYASAIPALQGYREEIIQTTGALVAMNAAAAGGDSGGVSGGVVRSGGGSANILGGVTAYGGVLRDAAGREITVYTSGRGRILPGPINEKYAQAWVKEWVDNMIRGGFGNPLAKVVRI